MEIPAMSFIYFITDQRPGEKDVLAGNERHPLVIRSCSDRRELIRVLPTSPWTHEQLDTTGTQLRALLEAEFTHEGADAFLGQQWVGSTEC